MSFTLNFPTIINTEGGVATLTFLSAADVPTDLSEVTVSVLDGHSLTVAEGDMTVVAGPLSADPLTFTVHVTVKNLMDSATLTVTHDSVSKTATFSHKEALVALTFDGQSLGSDYGTIVTTDKTTVPVTITVTDVHDDFDPATEIYIREMDDQGVEKLLPLASTVTVSGTGTVGTIEMHLPHDGDYHLKVWINRGWHQGSAFTAKKATPTISFVVGDEEVTEVTTNNKLVSYQLKVTNYPTRGGDITGNPTTRSDDANVTLAPLAWDSVSSLYDSGSTTSDEASEVINVSVGSDPALTATLKISRVPVALTVDDVDEDGGLFTFTVTPTAIDAADIGLATWTLSSTPNGGDDDGNMKGNITAVSGGDPNQLTFTITAKEYGPSTFELTSSETTLAIPATVSIPFTYWPDVGDTWNSVYFPKYVSGTQTINAAIGTTRPTIGPFESGTMGFRGIKATDDNTMIFGTLSDSGSIRDGTATWFLLRETTSAIPPVFKLEQPVTGIMVDMDADGEVDYMLTRI